MPGETRIAVPRPANPSPSTPYVPPVAVGAGTHVVAQFRSADGDSAGPPLNLPADADPEILEVLLNTLLNNDDAVPYSFFVDGRELLGSIQKDVLEGMKRDAETVVSIVYQPQAVFRLRPVTRCTASMEGWLFWVDPSSITRS